LDRKQAGEPLLSSPFLAPQEIKIMSNAQPVEILMVDDDAADIRLAEEALRDSGRNAHINAVHDGVEALNYLRGKGEYAEAVLPDLILLDLKMPKKGGLEVLTEIKQHEMLHRIPVIILTTSDAPEDILRAYDLQASCYVTKPADLAEFDRAMTNVKDFCLTVVKLPPPTSKSAGGMEPDTSTAAKAILDNYVRTRRVHK
jgi:CheY-like chemotaxis protein